MGWTPADVDACSLWQFQAALLGHVRANSPDDEDELSETEMVLLMADLDRRPVWEKHGDLEKSRTGDAGVSAPAAGVG